jgi:phosphopantothenate-cysteine ligase/phosphopantothenoylcysteine decarboxylase/phosphopantothenate--cysteine ligase
MTIDTPQNRQERPGVDHAMKMLVTAGNTQTMIDRVRCITNVFSGRTSAQIAVEAFERGHTVTLLTSHPEVLDTVRALRPGRGPDWHVHRYRTFEELESLMAASITGGGYDVVVHAAAVSDYEVAGIYAPTAGTHFDPSEVAVSEVELLDIAERSCRQSDANLIVANTLERMLDWACLGAGQCGHERVPCRELPERLIEIIAPKSGVSLGQ